MTMQLTNRAALLDALHALADRGALAADDAYNRALADLMIMLGLLTRPTEPTDHDVAVNGEHARLFIRSLAAHVADGVPMGMDWQSGLNKPTTAQGAKLLADVEAVRKDTIEHPTPTREITAVNGLIVKRDAGTTYVYMQYDEKARQFQLIGGKAEPDDPDPESTLAREMQEELELPTLARDADYTLMPLAERFEEITMSPTFGVVTSYTIYFFHVGSLRVPLREDSENVWVSLDELRAGERTDGTKISDLPLIFAPILDELPASIIVEKPSPPSPLPHGDG